jgi:hypothetical protein
MRYTVSMANVSKIKRGYFIWDSTSHKVKDEKNRDIDRAAIRFLEVASNC